jgi:hypothetical protein
VNTESRYAGENKVIKAAALWARSIPTDYIKLKIVDYEGRI